MTDVNGQWLAEFLIIDDQVVSIPSFALMHIIEDNPSLPISQAKPGRRWHLDYFVRYLVDVCAQYKHEPLTPFIESVNDGYASFYLDEHVNCRALANLVGVQDEQVRQILINHLTFPDRVKYV